MSDARKSTVTTRVGGPHEVPGLDAQWVIVCMGELDDSLTRLELECVKGARFGERVTYYGDECGDVWRSIWAGNE